MYELVLPVRLCVEEVYGDRVNMSDDVDCACRNWNAEPSVAC